MGTTTTVSSWHCWLLGLGGVVAQFLATNVIIMDGAAHGDLGPYLEGHLVTQTLSQSPRAP